MVFKINVSGMSCAACSARVEKTAKSVPGVLRADVNLLAGAMELEADSEQTAQNVLAAVTDAGYPASVQGAETQEPKKSPSGRGQLLRLCCSAAILAVLMYFTMGSMLGLPLPKWYAGTSNAMTAALLQFFLSAAVVLIYNAYYIRGIRALLRRSPNMDSLIAVGSGASMLYGIYSLFAMSRAMGGGNFEAVDALRKNLYFESAAMIVTLISLGKYLEARAKGKTGEAIRRLMDLRPRTAAVKRDGQEKTVPVEQVAVGDTVVLRSGARVPVDGTVLSGSCEIDESTLTGESVPAEKAPGSFVSAGTVVSTGYAEFRADCIGEDTTLSQVVKAVEQAGASKAPIARLADRIAGVFVPTVMAIAAVTFAVWMLAGKPFDFSLTCGISVLVISCPCALGLATPVAIMVGTGRGADLGILFKNARALENLHKIDTVVLDKTGTLTVGKPAVTDIVPGAMDKDTLLQVAAAVEQMSEHPFAKAILSAYGDGELLPAAEFETLPGLGVTAGVNGKKYYGGNRKLMQQRGITVPETEAYSREGKTPLFFATEDGSYCGMIAAADVLKEDAVQAVEDMQSRKLNVIMLTGDNEATAGAIARRANIRRVIANVVPNEKANTVRALQAEGRKVLMVGDGINDAPALATADVGMAMGNGTDIAMESADVVLMQGRLRTVVQAVALSRATVTNIRENLFWAFFYNILGIPIAAGVLYPAFGILLSPMLGAAAMSFSSVFVVTNALRLRFWRMPEAPKSLKEEQKMVIHVEGMMCTHCQARVESACKAVNGVTDAVVDLKLKQVTVTGNADRTAVIRAITDAGYEVKE